MRTLFILVFSIFYLENVTAQVTLYDMPNFQGTNKSFAIGTFRLMSEAGLNDRASSIRVPAGMGVIIFVDANETAGFGVHTDLLEDCADLSVYNLNDKISYINVFKIEGRAGHVWVRGRMVNNQYVSGHWERKRTNGQMPDNSPPATVAPSLDAPLSTSPTVLSINGANTIISSLGVQKTEERFKWDGAMKNQLGVIGNDFRGIEEIGSACFQRASNNIAIPDNLNFWYPQKQLNDHRSVVYFKRTLAGTITKVGQFINPGTFEDFDVNIDIRPDPPFQYLVTNGHKPENTTLMKAQHYGSLGYSGESDCPESFEVLEAEIADRYKPGAGYEAKLVTMNKPRVGKKICVYGTWIWDEGHCCHPEIHPAEQAWWSEPQGANKVYNMSVFCDMSGRYWWRDQMDDGTKLKPWAEPPIKGLFAIAFEYNIPKNASAIGYPNKKFVVSNIEHFNVIEYPNAKQTYNLVYNGNNIVSFIPNNNAFKVSFEQVGISPEDRNKIRGFLVFETSVGQLTQVATELKYPGTTISFKLPQGSAPAEAPQGLERQFFKKEGGYYYFTVTESTSGTIRDRLINGLERQ